MAKIARIYIDGEIIPDAWNWWGDEATSLINVRNQIDTAGEFDELEVYIFSPGGFCFEGWAIADYLLSLGKKVTTVAYGQCASIATIIYMAGTVRKITPNCDFMIHLPWGGVEGNEHAVLAYYNELVIEGDKIANRYAQVTGGDKANIKASLATDQHMTGNQAVEQGYATEILGAEPQALHGRSVNRPIKAATAYLRRPKNIALKTDAERSANKPITKPGAETQQSNMADNTKKPDLDGLLAGFAASMRNLFGGKPPKALDVNTDSGQVIVIDATGDNNTPVVGDKVTLKDSGAPAPDGDYTASEDKTVYTIANGAISNIVTPDTKSNESEQGNEGGQSQQANQEGQEYTDLAAANTRIKELEGQLTSAKASRKAFEDDMTRRLNLLTKALGAKQSKEIIVNADKVAGGQSAAQEQQVLSAVERKRQREQAKKDQTGKK